MSDENATPLFTIVAPAALDPTYALPAESKYCLLHAVGPRVLRSIAVSTPGGDGFNQLEQPAEAGKEFLWA